jgi:hypothetical protein
MCHVNNKVRIKFLLINLFFETCVYRTNLICVNLMDMQSALGVSSSQRLDITIIILMHKTVKQCSGKVSYEFCLELFAVGFLCLYKVLITVRKLLKYPLYI